MSSHDMKNPTGGVHMGHVMESPDPNGRLLERILSRENMLKAWKRVKANKGLPASIRCPLRSSLSSPATTGTVSVNLTGRNLSTLAGQTRGDSKTDRRNTPVGDTHCA